jgi:hypothetical protein
MDADDGLARIVVSSKQARIIFAIFDLAFIRDGGQDLGLAERKSRNQDCATGLNSLRTSHISEIRRRRASKFPACSRNIGM